VMQLCPKELKKESEVYALGDKRSHNDSNDHLLYT